MLLYFQNIPIIFFSAAKNTNERKISEASEEALNENENVNSDTDTASSDFETDEVNDTALKCTEEDIELFKKQLREIDKAVTNTADRLDRIQIALDKVVENMRLGKPIEPFHCTELLSSAKQEVPDIMDEAKLEEFVENVNNSHEICDRERLLAILKSIKLVRLKNPPRISVGMIGYPNVGKSSTVNVLMQTKKVSKYF